MFKAVALGFRVHSGWAAAVAASGSPRQPNIVERRRIETAHPGISGSKQPYHAAQGLCIERAETWIRESRESSTLLALRAISAWVAQLEQSGLTVASAGILYGSGRPLPTDLGATLRSHALIHTAEGEFFREVLVTASEHSALRVVKVKEREVWETAVKACRLPCEELQRRVGSLGKSIGPPWRQDEKFASLAAWIALAESNNVPLRRHSESGMRKECTSNGTRKPSVDPRV